LCEQLLASNASAVAPEGNRLYREDTDVIAAKMSDLEGAMDTIALSA
jgi:hypothetical protein